MMWDNYMLKISYKLEVIEGIISMWEHFLFINEVQAGLAELIYKHLDQLYMGYIRA